MIGITEMIWKTTNALGQEVTWYSEDEVELIKTHYERQLKAMIDRYNDLLKEYKERVKEFMEIRKIEKGLKNGINK